VRGAQGVELGRYAFPEAGNFVVLLLELLILGFDEVGVGGAEVLFFIDFGETFAGLCVVEFDAAAARTGG